MELAEASSGTQNTTPYQHGPQSSDRVSTASGSREINYSCKHWPDLPSFTDEIIKIVSDDGEDTDLHAHKHLLRERSGLLKADFEEAIDGCLVWGLDVTSASQYLGSLYGQPTWVQTPGSDIDKAWSRLDDILCFSTQYEDFDAADACLDVMRELLEHWHSNFNGPFAYVKMDL